MELSSFIFIPLHCKIQVHGKPLEGRNVGSGIGLTIISDTILYLFKVLSLQGTFRTGIVVPIMQMKKLRLREAVTSPKLPN